MYNTNMGMMMMDPMQTGPSPLNYPTPVQKKEKPKVKLSDKERGTYSALYSTADPNGNNKLPIKEFMTFLTKAKLPKEQIKQIWSIVITTGQTHVHRDEVYLALKLVAYAQNGIEVSEESIRENKECPFPNINLSSPHKPQLAQQAEPESEFISNEEKLKYFKWFDAADQTKLGYLNAQQMQAMFEKIPLPSELLSVIWDMSNIGGTNQFDKARFSLAMFLLAKAKKNIPLPQIPPTVLNYFKDIPNEAVAPPTPINAVPPPQPVMPSPNYHLPSKPQVPTSQLIKSQIDTASESDQKIVQTSLSLHVKAAQKSNELLSNVEKRMNDHLTWLKQVYEEEAKKLKEIILQNNKIEQMSMYSSHSNRASQAINSSTEYKKAAVPKLAIPSPSNNLISPNTQPQANSSNPFNQDTKSGQSKKSENKSELKNDVMDIKAFDMLDSSEFSVPSNSSPPIQNSKPTTNSANQNDNWLNFGAKNSQDLSNNPKEFEFND